MAVLKKKDSSLGNIHSTILRIKYYLQRSFLITKKDKYRPQYYAVSYIDNINPVIRYENKMEMTRVNNAFTEACNFFELHLNKKKSGHLNFFLNKTYNKAIKSLRFCFRHDLICQTHLKTIIKKGNVHGK